jgi:hypothetical protein
VSEIVLRALPPPAHRAAAEGFRTGREARAGGRATSLQQVRDARGSNPGSLRWAMGRRAVARSQNMRS